MQAINDAKCQKNNRQSGRCGDISYGLADEFQNFLHFRYRGAKLIIKSESVKLKSVKMIHEKYVVVVFFCIFAFVCYLLFR